MQAQAKIASGPVSGRFDPAAGERQGGHTRHVTVESFWGTRDRDSFPNNPNDLGLAWLPSLAPRLPAREPTTSSSAPCQRKCLGEESRSTQDRQP